MSVVCSKPVMLIDIRNGLFLVGNSNMIVLIIFL